MRSQSQLTWKRKNGCEKSHVGDAPAVHSGGSTWNTCRYSRTYTDGCVEIREWRQ